MTNVTTMITEQLNLRVKEMNQISYGILANTYVRQSLLFLSGYNYDNVNMLMYLSAYDMITDNIFTASMPFPDVDRVNVFSDNNIFFSSKRFDNSSQKIKEHMLSRKKPSEIEIDKTSQFLLTSPHINEWEEDSNEIVFSLQRIVQSSHGPIGIIEVQKKYSIISDICNIDNINSGNLYIIDSKGDFIYPFSKTTLDKIDFFLEYLEENKNSNTNFVRLYDKYTKSKQVVASKYSDYTGWTVIYALPESSLTEPIYKILNLILILGLISALFSFGIAFIIASHIYTPLRELKKKVEKFDYQKPNINDMDYTFSKTDVEIAVLNNSFNTLALRLQRSVEESIQTQSQIQKAYFKILQSQMNPHFLHNTISVISIMAKNLGDKKIPDICKKLNNLLVYTSNIREDYVTIEDEMDNISSYLGLLKYRYEHRLVYHVNIDPLLYDIKIPRMTLQPFVENSLKHGLFGINRAISILIEGNITDSGWEIIIKDDGVGIENTELSKIIDDINHFNINNTWINDNIDLKTKGLGVINTFTRLKILYGNNLNFEIKNLVGGGTEIRIVINNSKLDE